VLKNWNIADPNHGLWDEVSFFRKPRTKTTGKNNNLHLILPYSGVT
jgi:hypothetical protein